MLIADDRAEHVAGCNMAFRRTTLERMGGFDPALTSAGDDADVCWRLLDAGHAIGFAHAAQVWHHRRDTVARYLSQQHNYGRSESMVSGRHAERFNRLGQARWGGFLYSSPRLRWPLLRPVLYHGYFGLAPFQRVARRRADAAISLGSALLPLLAPAALAGAVVGAWWPLALIVPALAALLITSYAVLAASAVHPHRDEPVPFRLRCLAGAVHALQPFARTLGRLSARPLAPPEPPERPWVGDREVWLGDLRRRLGRGWHSVVCGSPTDGWDLAVAVGPCFRYRITTAVVWQWKPLWRGRLVPRRAFLTAAAAACVLPLADAAFILVPVVLIAGAGIEAWLLRRAVDRALRATIAGAALGDEER